MKTSKRGFGQINTKEAWVESSLVEKERLLFYVKRNFLR